MIEFLLLIVFIELITLIALIGMFIYLKTKIGELQMTQEEYDAEIARANAALEDIAQSIIDEAQQIRDYIANPVDVTAIVTVANHLETVSAAISGIFEPPTEPTEPEPVEPEDAAI